MKGCHCKFKLGKIMTVYKLHIWETFLSFFFPTFFFNHFPQQVGFFRIFFRIFFRTSFENVPLEIKTTSQLGNLTWYWKKKSIGGPLPEKSLLHKIHQICLILLSPNLQFFTSIFTVFLVVFLKTVKNAKITIFNL